MKTVAQNRYSYINNLNHILIIHYLGEISFISRIFKIEYLFKLLVLSSPESENHAFNDWSLCVYLRVSVVSTTQKRTTAGSSNLIL